jgi:hypothetical protein
MSLELIRESIKVNQVIGEDTTQTVVENDIIVPDIKPDIASIILLDGDVFVNSTEVLQEKILMSGIICFKILYLSDDSNQSVKSINTNAGFSYGLDILNAKPGMSCKVRCDIEHLDYNILNGRKINAKAIVRIAGKVISESEQNVISNIDSIEGVQVLKDTMRVNCFIGENEAEFILKEALDIPSGKPAIREILRNDVKITGKDYKMADNKVIAKGDLNISTLYISDDEDRSIQYMEHEVPFTQFIELPGTSESTVCDLEFKVGDSRFEPGEDSDGDLRVMNGEIELSISASGYEKRSIEAVEDAYSREVKIDLEKDSFRTEDIVCENKGQIILKDTVVVDDGAPEIAEVFNVLCKPVLVDYKIVDEKVIIEGVVNNNVLYLANSVEQPVNCYNQEVPFRHSIDVKGIKPNMDCNINLDVEHCNYSMVSSAEVEIRLVICLTLKVVDQIVIPLVVRVLESPMDNRQLESQPSLVIYFAKPGDNVWKIAKRYFTTVDDIRSMNDLGEHDQLLPGQQIIIPKRVS